MRFSHLPPKLVLLFTVLLVASLSSVNAQDGQRPSGRGRSGGFGGLDTMTLIRSEQVQEELEVTEQQKTKINETVEAVREELRGLTAGVRELSGEERQSRLAQIREKREKLDEAAMEQIKAALSGDQVERLDQIALQVRGVGSLADDDIAGKLGMSDV